MFNIKAKMNEEEQETNANEIFNLCFASGEFFVMKTMYARWSGPNRKGTMRAAMLSLTTIIKRGSGVHQLPSFCVSRDFIGRIGGPT